MDERRILDIDREGDVPNCAVASYRAEHRRDRDAVRQLDLVKFLAPLREAATPVTSAPDTPAAAKPRCADTEPMGRRRPRRAVCCRTREPGAALAQRLGPPAVWHARSQEKSPR